MVVSSPEPGSPPSRQPWTRDPLACARRVTVSGERDISDLLEETISLSDITEITDYRQLSLIHISEPTRPY